MFLQGIRTCLDCWFAFYIIWYFSILTYLWLKVKKKMCWCGEIYKNKFFFPTFVFDLRKRKEAEVLKDKLISPRCANYKQKKVANFLLFKYFLTSSEDKLIDKTLRIIWKINIKKRTTSIPNEQKKYFVCFSTNFHL